MRRHRYRRRKYPKIPQIPVAECIKEEPLEAIHVELFKENNYPTIQEICIDIGTYIVMVILYLILNRRY